MKEKKYIFLIGIIFGLCIPFIPLNAEAYPTCGGAIPCYGSLFSDCTQYNDDICCDCCEMGYGSCGTPAPICVWHERFAHSALCIVPWPGGCAYSDSLSWLDYCGKECEITASGDTCTYPAGSICSSAACSSCNYKTCSFCNACSGNKVQTANRGCVSGTGCTYDSSSCQCVKGRCGAQCNQDGTGCPSGQVCNTGTCTCSVSGCTIGGSPYANGACNGKCQYCDVSQSTTAWSNVPSGKVCVSNSLVNVDENNYCNHGDDCSTGDCSGQEWWTSCNGASPSVCRSAGTTAPTDSHIHSYTAPNGYVLKSDCSQHIVDSSYNCGEVGTCNTPSTCSGSMLYEGCSGGSCSSNPSYGSTTTDNSVCDGVVCSSTDYCSADSCSWYTGKKCSSGSCSQGYGGGSCNPYTCSGSSCTSTCSKSCGAQCENNEDCPGSTCQANCICSAATIPPYFSVNATNTTVAGKPANFTISVTDDVNLGSTAGYIFSTNNSGTWKNSSYRSFAGSGLTLKAWNVTTLNNTIGALVQWRFYANDTSNNWNKSAIYNLTTTTVSPVDIIPPTFSNYNANTTIAGAPVNFSTVITDNVALSGYIFETNNTGRRVNYTWTPLSSGGTAYNITTLNSTVGTVVNISFYANDTSNNWAVYRTSLTTTTTTDSTPPYFSANATNTTVAGQPANFTINVTDNVNLGSTAGYIFSTNNSGTWINSSYRSFAGSGLTLTAWNVTTLNSTVRALVQWRFYANDTSNNWNKSAIYNLTTTVSGRCYIAIASDCNPPDVTIFKISDLANAHAEMPNQNNYNYRVCCKDVGNSSSGNYDIVIKLSDITNAHVAKKTYDYGTRAYMSGLGGATVVCNYCESPGCNQCSDLGSDYFCVASISSDTNAHVGDCNAYSTKACCKISGVVINPLCDPTKDDFTGTCQYLALYGDLSYLNIKWNARYSSDVEKEIGIDCYLNCPDPDGDINTNCAAYKNSTNYCSYKSLTGYGFCTIVNPGYLFKGQINNVTCSFYDPANPTVNYLSYPNRTFKPINFDVQSALSGSVTVGKPFALLVNVRNFGLFVGNFTSNTSALNDPYLVSIENPIGLIENLKHNGIGEMYSKVTFLSAKKINFKVLVKSNLDPTTCSISIPTDCNYLGSGAECINNKCWKRITVEINSGMLSLPEFNWTGLLQIIIISTVVVFFSKKRKL